MGVTIESTAGFAAGDPLARLYQGITAIAGEREPDATCLLLDLVEAALRASRMSEATAAQAWADRAAAQLRATKLARPRGERCASGGADAAGTRDRRARGRWPEQQADRPPPVPVTPYRRRAPLSRLP